MQETTNKKTGLQSNVISLLWGRFFPYWPLFIVLFLIFGTGTWFFLRFKLPVYESTAALLINDGKKGSEESRIIENLNGLATKKIIENEVEVIKSRELMGRVVRKLKLYAPVFEEAKWKDLSAYTSSPVVIEAEDPDKIIEAKRVDFSFDRTNSTVKIGEEVYPLEQWVTTPYGNLKFIHNNKLYRYKAPLYFALINPKRVTKKLTGRLDVAITNKLSSVVNLRLSDEVPRRSEDILNTLIAAYDSAAISDKNSLAASTLAFVEDRLGNVEQDLNSIEKKLQQYRSRKGAIDLSSQGKLFLENVSTNDQKLSDVNMKLAVLGQVEQYISSKENNGGLVPSTLGVDDPFLTGLLEKLYDAELQYEKLRRTTPENNPTLLSVVDQIDRMKPGILENIRSQRRSLEATKSNLYSTNSAYTSLLQNLPQQERELVEISREQNIKSGIYSFLLQKREETALSQSTVSDSRIVDRAESSLDPVGIGGTIIYGIAVILAIALGMGLIIVREMFNKTVLFRQEIEALTSFPVVGEVIMEKSKSSLVIGNGKPGLVAEQFRMLRTALPYLGINTRRKKLLITSTIPGEGKSFIAANLGLSLALGGKKVILIDFDLSNSTLADKLGMQTTIGVADYLVGEIELEDAIRRSPSNPNLFLMAAGAQLPNPSELILGDRTAQLFQYVEETFDFIIVDSAPVGLLSDGYVLSEYCDATLYVVRHGCTPKKMLQRLEENNKITQLKNLALVFNGVRRRGFSKDSYGYGYSSSTYYKTHFNLTAKSLTMGN